MNKHFGRLLGQILSVPHSQQDWWKSSQPACMVHLQPATWLTGKFPSRSISRHYGPVWLWPKDIIQTLSGRGGGFRKDRCGKKGDFFAFSEGGGRWGWGRNFWQKSVTYSRHQFPSDTDNIFFPAKLSVPEHIISSKSSSQQKLTWRTDILRNRSIGCPCFSFACTLHWINKIPVLARGGGTHGCRDRHFVHRAPRLTAAYWKPNYRDLYREPTLLFVNCTLIIKWEMKNYLFCSWICCGAKWNGVGIYKKLFV